MSADAVEALTREYEYQWTYGGWNSLPTAERTPKYCAAGEYEILLIYGHAPSYPPEPQDMTVIGKRLRRCGDASFLESHLFPTPQKEGTVPKEWE
jgi:hypothetical protein